MARIEFLLPMILLFAGCTRGPAAFDTNRARELWPAMNIKSTGPSDFEGHGAGKKMKLTVYENVDPAKAARIMDLETARLKNLYRTDILPYHGAVSRETGCEKGEKPRFDSGPEFVSAELLTNERLVPGSCDPSQAFYRASFRFVHCPGERRLFLLHVYIPKAEAGPGAAPEAEVIKCAG